MMYFAKAGLVAVIIAIIPSVQAEPAPLKWGEADVIPKAAVAFTYDDDILSDDTDVESLVTIVNPSIYVVSQKNFDKYSLFYDLKSGTYASSSNDNYLDQQLDGKAHVELDSRNRLDINLNYIDSHVERGSVDSSLGVTEPDEYNVSVAAIKYGYGVNALQGGTARFDVFSNILARRYSNNISQTAKRELDSNALGGTLYYRVAPKTELLLEVKRANYDYKLSTSLDNNDEVFYLTGVTWDGGAWTSGTIKVGSQKKYFDDQGKGDVESGALEASMKFSPKSYSHFTFSAQVKAGEATGDEDYIEGAYSSVSWRHDWKERINSRFSYSYSDEDLIDNNKVSSERKSTAIRIALNYQFRRWLSLGLAYRFSNRTNKAVNQPLDPVYDRDFSRNQYTINLEATL